jgi:thiamine biosynthesis lipoprotein
VKGWTVDLVVESLQTRYPDLLVNAGGDLRCAGVEPGVAGWLVAVEGAVGPVPAQVLWEGALNGALATSTTRKRRWRSSGGEMAHHVIDPATGLPACSPFDHVSVWAPQTWLAEVWAKVVLVGGRPAAEEAARQGVRIMAATPTNEVEWFGS